MEAFRDLQAGADPKRVDQCIYLYDVSWEQYDALLRMRGDDNSSPRMTYLEGVLELMTTSQPHEYIKTTIARLLETWGDVMGVDLHGYGSWTIRSRKSKRGAEPDECYSVGERSEDPPDLAIEVIWTHGGIEKLEVYRKLGVREVWLWDEGRIEIHTLVRDHYVRRPASVVLPELDLKLLSRFVDEPNQPKAARAYRAALMRKKH